jgi:lipoprotein NlpI
MKPDFYAPRFSCLFSLLLATVIAILSAAVHAQTSVKGVAKTASPRPALSAASSNPATLDYSFGPQPRWAVDLPATRSDAIKATPGQGRASRIELWDEQWYVTDTKISMFMRTQTTASEQGALREVSEPQIYFNPAFQKLQIHTVTVIRGGVRSDRIKSSRIEVLRREQMLERQIVDGMRTALVIVPDVRVNDVVEISYTVEGQNPIFENRFATMVTLGIDIPIDRLHWRVSAPPERTFKVQGLSTELQPERLTEGNRQVLRILRDGIAATRDEAQTPPWHKVYPALIVSEYRDWADVQTWANRLFTTGASDQAIQKLANELKEKHPEQSDALVAALRFVQDNVRYFSVSLGESSHRPKPASKTLDERLGDCKDKVVLFNALATQLGVEAVPVLVSLQRNRAVQSYIATPAAFDHVISRVKLADKYYFVDPTASQQGLSLAVQGYFPYGAGLVIGSGPEPTPIQPPDFAVDRQRFILEWDFSDLSKASVPMVWRMEAYGQAAEYWRGAFSAGALEKYTQAVAGGYARAYSNFNQVGTAQLTDDRKLNRIDVTLRFTYAGAPRYARGSIIHEFGALEMLDYLVAPQEGKRTMPYWLTMPKNIEAVMIIRGPHAINIQTPAMRMFGDARHLSGSIRYEVSGKDLRSTMSLERRADSVLPENVPALRERIAEARRLVGQTLRIPLLENSHSQQLVSDLEKRISSRRSEPDDQLSRIMLQDELNAMFAEASARALHPDTELSSAVLVEQARSLNQLARFNDALRATKAALKTMPSSHEAHSAMGVSLMGLARVSEAIVAFEQAHKLRSNEQPEAWIGIAHYYANNHAKAEQYLKDILPQMSGISKEFTNVWLYLSAEQQQRGRGLEMIPSDERASVESANFPREILRYVTDQIDQAELLRKARENKSMERLNLAEAYFFIGKKLQLSGQHEQAREWFQKVTAINAFPYREHSLALIELGRPETR